MRHPFRLLLVAIAIVLAGSASAGGQAPSTRLPNTPYDTPVMTRGGEALSMSSTGHEAFPLLFPSSSRTDTGRWQSSLGMACLTVDVNITVGGGKSATVIVSVTSDVTATPTGSSHGQTVLTICQSGIYSIPINATCVKIRIDATNGATRTVSAVLSQSACSGTWVSTSGPLDVVGSVALSGQISGSVSISSSDAAPVVARVSGQLSGSVTVSSSDAAPVVTRPSGQLSGSVTISSSDAAPVITRPSGQLSGSVTVSSSDAAPVVARVSGQISGSVTVSSTDAAPVVVRPSGQLSGSVTISASNVRIPQGDRDGLGLGVNMSATHDTDPVRGNYVPGVFYVRNIMLDATILTATATGGVGAGITLTLPAVAGQYHFIREIEFNLFATANRTAAAAPIIVTTTNLNNQVYWVDAAATSKGEFAASHEESGHWIRSAAAGTATTIVLPAVTDCIWNAYAQYVTKP